MFTGRVTISLHRRRDNALILAMTGQIAEIIRELLAKPTASKDFKVSTFRHVRLKHFTHTGDDNGRQGRCTAVHARPVQFSIRHEAAHQAQRGEDGFLTDD